MAFKKTKDPTLIRIKNIIDRKYRLNLEYGEVRKLVYQHFSIMFQNLGMFNGEYLQLVKSYYQGEIRFRSPIISQHFREWFLYYYRFFFQVEDEDCRHFISLIEPYLSRTSITISDLENFIYELQRYFNSFQQRISIPSGGKTYKKKKSLKKH